MRELNCGPHLSPELFAEVSQYIVSGFTCCPSLICQLRVLWNFPGTLLEEEVQEEGQSVGSLCLGEGSSDCSGKH